MADQSQQGRGGGLELWGWGWALRRRTERKGREQTPQTNQGAGHPLSLDLWGGRGRTSSEPGPPGLQGCGRDSARE